MLESDETRRDWSSRGPLCEGWPVYHAVYDELGRRGLRRRRERVAWLGVWRSGDLGETWTHSSDGLADDQAKRRSKGLEASSPPSHDGRIRVGVEAPGIFESTDGGETLVAPEHARRASPVVRNWNDPADQPPGHLGHVGDAWPTPTTPTRFWAIVQGIGHLRDDRRRGRRGRRGTGACAPTGRGPTRRSASASTGSCARQPTRPHVPAEPCGHAPERRLRPHVDRDHRRAADRVRVRRRGAPARPRHLL